MNNITQSSINNHLTGKGLAPSHAVYGSLQDLRYLMNKFLEAGGVYDNAMYSQDTTWPPEFLTLPYLYPNAVMRVSYGDEWLLIKRGVSDGYPVVIVGTHCAYEDVYDEDAIGVVWNTVLVHPDHLDATLCHLLEVPTSEA